MRPSTTILLFAAALVLAGPAGTARAEDGAAVVAKRQALMKEQGKDMKAVKNYIDGKGALGPAQAGAADLVHTMEQIPSLFPKDTGMAQFPKSEAKADIWSEWDKFLAARQTAATKVAALNAAFKEGDKGKIAAAYADLGKHGCGACHGTFREKKKS
jgi:cytochrome c556